MVMMTKSNSRGARQFATWQRAHRSRRFSSILLNDVRSAGSGGQIVTMIQTARSWHRYYSATGIGTLLCLPTVRGYLLMHFLPA